MSGKNQEKSGKNQEKSGNFEMDDKWQPGCKIIFHLLPTIIKLYRCQDTYK